MDCIPMVTVSCVFIPISCFLDKTSLDSFWEWRKFHLSRKIVKQTMINRDSNHQQTTLIIAINPEMMNVEKDNNAAERATISDVYIQPVLMDPASVSTFRFFEDTSITTGSNRYVLVTEDQQPAIFHTIGSFTHLSVTAG